ncbi:hypothetical protein GALMADRAFT_746104 [Galerina marginata CBS 339.88]|uniref:Uncharacterized protein n=1 Tax=Galerina marginata (strain CBS 339.88) TaxID=685588 RepID=A0A067SSM2_GALM3|nr:hypothetical protein GALMADRAFT_746104 [Galerina marginata CBS 339.88]
MTDTTSTRPGGSMPPPASYPPIVIPVPADPKSTCINRDWFPNLHIDVQRDYAKYYNIPDATDLSSAEIVSILCTKNKWIPALEEHEWDITDHGVNPFRRVPSGLIEEHGEQERLRREARYGKFPLERHPSPEDEYDFVEDDGQHDADKGKGRDVTGHNEDGEKEEWYPYSRPALEFRYPPVPRVVGEEENGDPILEPLEPDWLRCMLDELERNHRLLKAAIEDAYTSAREAEADAFELTAQISEEKKYQQQVFELVSTVCGRKVAEQIEDDVAYAMENGELPGRGAGWKGYGSDSEGSDDEDGHDGDDGDNEDEQEEQDTQPRYD